MSDIITCSKCNGSGEYIFKSGVVGHCYQCNGKGSVKRVPHKTFLISIIDNDGNRINWLHNTARNEKEAIRKARVVAARGCYKNQIETIAAAECGVEYTYHSF